jgi:2-C-methyl-D-erythritol 2,4-cyclodiphosphate synthase
MKPPFRIGNGFDFHPFAEGRRLVLGGVEFEWERGLEGHSDADALLHAITDAILGAAGSDDIGSHFPDTDPRYHGISSLVLLRRAAELVTGQGYRVVNVDAMVLAETPRIKPYVPAMKANVAEALGVPVADVGIKATTMEGRGVIGREEGIAVLAVALVWRPE